MPRTVKAPPRFDAVFDKAEERLSRFFQDRRDDPAKGTIEISDERFILVRGAALSIEFFEVIKRLFKLPEKEAASVAGRLLFDIGHALGKSDASYFHKSNGLEDPIGKLSAGPVFFAHAGWASVNISEESNFEPTEDYFLLYDHTYSFEADAWIRAGKLSGFPVCHMNAGYSSGWCEESFGVPLVAVEVSCRARGDEACRFIMSPPARIEAHVSRHLGHAPERTTKISVDEISKSFKRDWAKEAMLEDALRDRERDYRRLFEVSPDAIVVWNTNNTIQSANKAAATLLGYENAEDLIGRNWLDFVVLEDRHSSAEGIQRAEKSRGLSEAEFKMQRKDGSRFFAQGRLVVVLDSAGNPVETIAMARDITNHKTTEAALRVQALHDSLTGLPNRPAFLQRLHEAFASSRRRTKAFAVLYIDIDLFKDVNDTLGHETGDHLLQAVAARLKSELRESDIVARFGGDEFAVLQFDLNDPSDAGVLAAKLTKSMAAPYRLNGNEVHVTISTGIAIYDPAIPDPETMLTQADLALYRAKGEGRDRYCFHATELDRQVRERVTLANELRAGLDNRELELHYQLQVEMVSGRIVGVEALARWHHPRRGLVMPEVFIPVAEHVGLIKILGRWVLDESCRQMKLWRAAGIAPPIIAVNVSAAQFKADQEFEKDFAEIVAKYGLSSSDVELELTESVLLETTQEHRSVAERLQQSGVRISIDDFGTGYSSLGYLRNHRFNRLKISQQFINGVPGNSGDVAITRATLGLARELGIGVIAEGVETAKQAAFLLSLGCEYAQGYHFARPLPAEGATALLRQGRIHVESSPAR